MDNPYHELKDFLVLADSCLKLDRSKALLEAIGHHRDYSLVGLSSRVDGKVECIVVDVETDRVPPKNLYGIKYKERLALCVPDNPKNLVEVLALRKTFPILMHQNLTPTDAPKSLCLYFELPASVTRSWTPQKFLRRIQWWLEMSAKGELHPADQPVEQLFFMTGEELVLPWNFEDIRDKAEHQLVIFYGESRPNGNRTYFLRALPKGAPEKGVVRYIRIFSYPIAQGTIERVPTTLGDLAEILSARGVDILPQLKKSLRLNIGSDGVQESMDEDLTIILLHVPITREDGKVYGATEKAFAVKYGPSKLGLLTGALMSPPGQIGSTKRYYSSEGLEALGGAESCSEWRVLPLFPMEVLRQNDASSARKQSDIAHEGPTGVIVGAGSLGSALINIWGRSGWGKWTVIDKDHIKPHNLSRHTARVWDIGKPKASAVAELHDSVMDGATSITPLNVDACDFLHPSVSSALMSSKLVIDASTTLEYPRAVSQLENIGRHISVFLTPKGNDSVLLAEDEQRKIRLRTLEAQYYRALIHEGWGKDHLDGNLGSYWSGASCRDISLIMPYSRILSHASTLSEQISLIAGSEKAAIRIWKRDPDRGTIVVHDVAPSIEIRDRFGDLEVCIDAALLDQIRAWRATRLPSETGGELLGYYDFNISSVTVVASLPPPPDSKGSPSSFQRGTEGLLDAVREASRRTAGIVDYIGEWHSHPPKHSASPSGDDFIQLAELTLRMSEDGLPALQLIVGEHDFRIIQGTLQK